MFDFTPLLQQLAHNDGALDVVGLAVAIQYSGLAGIHFKADFGFCVGHGLGVLGGQSSRIYFDVAVAEVANVEVFAHAATRSFSSGWRAAICDTTPRTWLATDVLNLSGHIYTAWALVYPMASAAFFGDPPSRSIASCLFIGAL